MKQHETKKIYTYVLIAGIIFTAFNLRPAITSVGPLIGTIRDEMGFANWNVALLTSLPLIAFAIMSPFAPRLANKYTNERALILGLVLLAVGVVLRSVPLMFLLFAGTLLIGFGIAVCNVLLPGVIKEKFPTKIALMTSVYTASMAIFATLGSAVSIPIADGLQLGWEIALLIWVIPVVVAGIIWFIISKGQSNQDWREYEQTFYEQKGKNPMWQSAFAWKIALFMGFQSTLFYVGISWIPEILIDQGISKATAGYLLSYFQFIGIPVSFLVPMIAMKMRSQSLFVVLMNMFYLIGIILLLLEPNFPLIVLAITIIGMTTSGNFVLALMFFAVRAESAQDAAALSGMAQSIGYIVAAIGPIIIGFIFDLTQSWTIPLYLIIGIVLCVMYFGFYAGKNEYVIKQSS